MDHGTEKFGAMMDVPLSHEAERLRAAPGLAHVHGRPDRRGAASSSSAPTRSCGAPTSRTPTRPGRTRSAVIDKNLTGVADSGSPTKVLHDNAAALYRIDV